MEKEITRKNRNVLVYERAEHLDAANKLTTDAIERGKDLTADERKEVDAHVSAITAIDRELERRALLDKQPITGAVGVAPVVPVVMPGSPANGNGAQWVDPKSGRPVCVLRPDQTMASVVEPVAYGEPPLDMGKYFKGLITGKWKGAEREFQAAQAESSGGSGQYLVPAPLSSQIIDKVRNASVMLRAGALTVPMESQTLSIARVAQDVTPAWHTEAAAITASDMTFESVKFTAQSLAAICVASVELYEDAANLSTLIPDTIAKVLAIELDRACLCGSGTAPEPRGIRNQTSVVVDTTTFGTDGAAISTTTPTGAVAWDWLSKQVSGLWSVNENPNAAIYSARTAGELDLLRATTGEVLPPPGSVSKLQLLYTNSIPNNLVKGGSNDCSEAFVGDFSQAMIGMRTQLMLEFSRQANVGSTSLFSTMQVGIRAYLRADFQVARPGAFRVVTGIR